MAWCRSAFERSDRSDPHTSATGAATAWDDLEVTPRSTLPIGSELYLRDPGDLKGEVQEFEGSADGQRGSFQEASENPNQRLVRAQVKRRPLGFLGIPEDGARPERRTITGPTWGKDRRPREANPYDPPRFKRSVAKPGQEHALKMWWKEVPYGAGEEASRNLREHPSKRQKRIQWQQYAKKAYEPTKMNPGATGKVYTVAGDFRQSQRYDPSLKNAWQQALNHEENVLLVVGEEEEMCGILP
ncbi:hypothetical protein NDU88_002696 [Pleurodeles waltl]|uniref:Uncharacterized protein n=1 Tax=Pleurodeles waltl TaxID=8319 RepID=A0AAV7SDG8_PLEWA|nr:hypothetical protein NDU88_002696 [Pleurodeles waltl]